MTQIQREKMLEAIRFFAEETINCRLTKLLKLLYFLDFIHFKEIGRPVTGLVYKAWRRGPVPSSLYGEIKYEQQPDFKSKVQLKKVIINDKPALNFVAVGKPDLSIFTRREKRILKELTKKYFKSNAEDMVEETHFKHLPWHQVYKVERRSGEVIPYNLALDELLREPFEEFTSERDQVFQFIANHSV